MKLLRPLRHPPQMTKIESSDGNYLLFDLQAIQVSDASC